MSTTATTPNAIGAVCRALAVFLLANMPDLKAAQEGWPAANQALIYPSITVYARAPKFSPLNPYISWKGTVDPVTHLTPFRKVVGMYDFTLQLDLWAAYKPQRDVMIEELIQAFNTNGDVPGVDLTLAAYFNETCHLSIDSLKNVDDEAGVQRSEWRAIVTVLGNVKVLSAKTGYVMETIENSLDTPDAIVVTDTVDNSSII